MKGRYVKCFRCGKKPSLVEGLCRDCYLETHETVKAPAYIDLIFCPRCRAISGEENRWKDFEDFERGIAESALQHIRIARNARIREIDTEVIEQDPRNYLLRGRVFLDIGDLNMEFRFKSKIRLKKSTCPRCSRIHGGYYEAIIQVRAPDRDMSRDEKNEAVYITEHRIYEMSRQSRDIFITSEEEIHGGLDFYISSSRAARNVAKDLATHFSGKITESKKLVGRKEGKDIYRFTYLVRIPEFRKDDFIEYMGEYYQIISNTGKTWRIYSLEKQEERKVSSKESRKFKKVRGKEDVEDAVVVSYRDGEVQVLHPETYKTITLRSKNDPGESMKIIRIKGEIYALREYE